MAERLIAGHFKCSPRSVERYLKEARQRLREHRGQSHEDLQAASMAFYELILQDPNARSGDKLFARKRLDQLLGLEEPQRHELSGKDGGPIVHDLDPKERLARLLDGIATRQQETGAAEGNDAG